MTSPADPRVERAAWESLATVENIDPGDAVQPDWTPAVEQPDAPGARGRHRRGARARERPATRSFSRSTAQCSTPARPLRLARLWIQLPDGRRRRRIAASRPSRPAACCRVRGLAIGRRELEAVRLLQIGLGDMRVKEGGPKSTPGIAAIVVTDRCGHAREDSREAGAVVSQCRRRVESRAGPAAGHVRRRLPLLLAGHRAVDAQKPVEDDIHYLIVVSLLGASARRDVTAATASCLLGLHKKLEDLGQFASRNWPFRVGEAVRRALPPRPGAAHGACRPATNLADRPTRCSSNDWKATSPRGRRANCGRRRSATARSQRAS